MSFTLTDYQQEAVNYAAGLSPATPRLCLYYKTGAGKSVTALSCLKEWGHKSALVIAPPSTHDQWLKLGESMGFDLQVMSHAKFRMKSTKLSRTTPVIADEMHQFGGVKGVGWKKLERLARTLNAPMILASATPNYNDAERVYCIHRILDPEDTQGGYLEFLYKHCITSQNPFSVTPDVVGFRECESAKAYLAALPGVMYLPDDVELDISYRNIQIPWDSDLQIMEEYGYNRRRHRMIASGIEKKHTQVNQQLLDDNGYICIQVENTINECALGEKKVVLFAAHATIAEALAKRYVHSMELVTGKQSTKEKTRAINSFKNSPEIRYLIGTASLATGTDGLDKVCDTMIIVDDTEDASLRRQLMGRILPRGLDTDASGKSIYVLRYM